MTNFTEADGRLVNSNNPKNSYIEIPNGGIALASSDDTFSISSQGRYNIYGGDGTDTLVVDYSSISTNSTNSTNKGFYTGTSYFGSNAIFLDKKSNYIAYTGIEKLNITGTQLDDTFRGGGNGNNNVKGEGGNDTFFVSFGNTSPDGNFFDGGEGNDILSFSFANNKNQALTIKSTKENKATINDGTNLENIEELQVHLRNNANDSILWLGTGNDDIKTSSGNDTIVSGAGNDILNGGDGYDSLTGANPQAVEPGKG